MSVLTAIEKTCAVVGLDIPTAVFSSSDREHRELAALANEMAARIAKAHEWQALNALATYTGDGSTEDFDLPSDYDRMLKKAQVWSSALSTPLSPLSDRDKWLGFEVQNFDFVINSWILYGGQLHIKPALGAGVTAKHWYQSKQYAASSEAVLKDSFTADADRFRLDERLLSLGMIWQWRANKSLPYAQDQDAYEDLLQKLASDDKGARAIRVGAPRLPADVRQAYPLNINP